MHRRLAKVVALVLLGVLLATLPGLVGCGGGGGTTAVNEIKYGWVWDFTGRAAKGTTELLGGMQDYFRMLEDTGNPLPVKIKVLTYDGRSEASRVLAGYVWMKGQGVDMVSMAPHDMMTLRSDFQADQIPCFASSTLNVNLDSQWMLTQYGSPEAQLDVIMQWIIDNWAYNTKGKPKVGYVGLAGVPFYEYQRADVEDWTVDHPDKFEWVGAQMAPSTTTSWAAEISKLKVCDYIMMGMSGPPIASFLIEAKNRGVTSMLAGPLESALAFWGLVKGAVPESALDGIISGYYYPWISEDVPVINAVKEWAPKYHSEKEMESIYLGTGEWMGWSIGMIVEDAVRRAAAEVGAENVDKMVLFEALKETNMTVEGFAIPWKVTAKANALMRGVKLLRYDGVSAHDWVLLQDWKVPAVLGD